jgi:hypothetical protein
MPDDATSNPIGSRKLFLKIIESKDIRRFNIPTEISEKSIPHTRFFSLESYPADPAILGTCSKAEKNAAGASRRIT